MKNNLLFTSLFFIMLILVSSCGDDTPGVLGPNRKWYPGTNTSSGVASDAELEALLMSKPWAAGPGHVYDIFWNKPIDTGSTSPCYYFFIDGKYFYTSEDPSDENARNCVYKTVETLGESQVAQYKVKNCTIYIVSNGHTKTNQVSCYHKNYIFVLTYYGYGHDMCNEYWGKLP